MSKTEQQQNESLLEKEKVKVKKPDKYNVILHNDDFTTMEFVIEILVKIFQKDVVTASKIMTAVHKTGHGVAGIYSYDIAKTKVNEVHKMARDQEFPLKCTVEKA